MILWRCLHTLTKTKEKREGVIYLRVFERGSSEVLRDWEVRAVSGIGLNYMGIFVLPTNLVDTMGV